MTCILIYGPNRTRMKLGEVGLLKLAEARAKARTILAERDFGPKKNLGQTGRPTPGRALKTFFADCVVPSRLHAAEEAPVGLRVPRSPARFAIGAPPSALSVPHGRSDRH